MGEGVGKERGASIDHSGQNPKKDITRITVGLKPTQCKEFSYSLLFRTMVPLSAFVFLRQPMKFSWGRHWRNVVFLNKHTVAT